MTEPNRAELLTLLAELADRYPHWRIGQLVANMAGWANVEIWDVEDEQLVEAAREHLRQAAERERPSVTAQHPTPQP